MRVDPEPTLKALHGPLTGLGFEGLVRQDEDMPTPYERPPAPLGTVAADRRAARRVLTRPSAGKVVAGVCIGLAEHLGWSVRWIRLAFVLLSIPTGAGLVAYIFLWALTPSVRRAGKGRRAVDPADADALAAAGLEEVEPSPR
jgi:phage shock protein PspC (stress-responsive transcriptional regulator)